MPKENNASSKKHKSTKDITPIRPAEADEKHSKADNRNENASQNQGVRPRSAEKSMQVLSIILSALVFVAIVYQAYIYNEQRKLMEKTLKYGTRAFVYAKDAFMIGGRGKQNVPQPDKPGFVCITFENTGNTSARNVILDVTSVAIRGELSNDFSYPSVNKPNDARCLIGPKATPQTIVSIDDVTLGEIYSGAKNFFVYGTITYNDIFGDSRKTQFCLRYNKSVLNDDGTISKTIFGPCAKHNCDDDNCPEKWGDNDAGLRPP